MELTSKRRRCVKYINFKIILWRKFFIEETEKKEKYKLGKSAAKEILQKMLDHYEIDLDEIDDKDLKRAIGNGTARLITAIRRGRLEFKYEKGIKVFQTLKDGSDIIEYREIDGIAKTEMAGKEPSDHYGKSYALMGSLCGRGEAAIKKLTGVDLSLVEVLGLIFLSV